MEILISPSKIQTYMDCPRQYYYRYILGWKSEEPSQDLVFGSAFHIAMEHLLTHGYSLPSVSDSYEKFLEEYRKTYSPETDLQYHPKSPGNAMVALAKYVQFYSKDNFETLYTEIAGTVPISDSRFLRFRLDSIVRDRDSGKIYSLEHKTLKTLSRQWIDQWTLKFQIGTYLHVLHCLYEPEEIGGIYINGVQFKTKDVEFQRVLCKKSPDMLEAWLTCANSWYSSIEEDILKLEELRTKERETSLDTFRQNTESCTKYFGCSYHDFCMAWANPLDKEDILPIGFKQELQTPTYDRTKYIFTKDTIVPVDQIDSQQLLKEDDK